MHVAVELALQTFWRINVSNCIYFKTLPRHSLQECLEWDIAETLLETLTLQLSSGVVLRREHDGWVLETIE